MTDRTWEKSADKRKNDAAINSERWKFLLGGFLILAAVGYLVLSGTIAGARYFIGVNDILTNPEYVGQTVRLSGAVIGDTIEYDSINGTIQFTVVHVPEEFDDLAQALNEAVNNPNAERLTVYIEDTVKPELLQHEAQAIMTGTLNEDGVFEATELNLKCPSRFEEDMPPDHNNIT